MKYIILLCLTRFCELKLTAHSSLGVEKSLHTHYPGITYIYIYTAFCGSANVRPESISGKSFGGRVRPFIFSDACARTDRFTNLGGGGDTEKNFWGGRFWKNNIIIGNIDRTVFVSITVVFTINRERKKKPDFRERRCFPRTPPPICDRN